MLSPRIYAAMPAARADARVAEAETPVFASGGPVGSGVGVPLVGMRTTHDAAIGCSIASRMLAERDLRKHQDRQQKPHATSLPARLYADLACKPFLKDARGPKAYDCVGLTIEIQRRRGIVLPDYASTPEALHAALSADKGMLGPCTRLDRPEAGCIVLLDDAGDAVPFHLGTMVDPYRMIHAWAYVGSVVMEVLRQSIWANRVIGFYRPEGA